MLIYIFFYYWPKKANTIDPGDILFIIKKEAQLDRETRKLDVITKHKKKYWAQYLSFQFLKIQLILRNLIARKNGIFCYTLPGDTTGMVKEK
jgi:hypothetical protein